LRPLTSRLAIGAACLSIGIGGWLSIRGLPWGYVRSTPKPQWEMRYESLLPLLAGEPRVLFLQQENDPGVHRLFRAQFVLGPAVIEERATLDKVQIRQLLLRPLILDFRQPRALKRALGRLQAAAERERLELAVERPLPQLAVVRARRVKRS
jgi:hypothetical protein